MDPKSIAMNPNTYIRPPKPTRAIPDPKTAKKRPFWAVFQLFLGEKIIKGGDFSFASSHPYKKVHFCSKQPFSQIHPTPERIQTPSKIHLSVPIANALYIP